MKENDLRNCKTVLVTGGAGFVGHHILEFLLRATNWNLVSLDRLDFSGNLSRINEVVKDMPEEYKRRLKVVYHDLKAEINADLREEIGQPDIILHIAAASHVQRSIKYPLDFIRDNVIGTANLLEFARTLSTLSRFIYFSTDEVFGPSSGEVKFNEYDRYNSTNPYSASKAAAEEICVAYSNTYNIPTYITHTMNIFGERQSDEKYIPMCARAISEGRKISIHKDPLTGLIGSRSYLYVKDIADALLFLLNREMPLTVPKEFSPLKCPKFNIAGLVELNNFEVATIVAQALQKELIYEFVDPNKDRPGHDLRYHIDGGVMEGLGWKAKYDVRKMIGEVAKFSAR